MVFTSTLQDDIEPNAQRDAKQHLAGLTLIEGLVVVAALAMLAAMLYPIYVNERNKAFHASCLWNQMMIASAIMLKAREANNTFPDTVTAWQLSSFPDKMFHCPAAPGRGNSYLYNDFVANKSFDELADMNYLMLLTEGHSAVGKQANIFYTPDQLEPNHQGQIMLATTMCACGAFRPERDGQYTFVKEQNERICLQQQGLLAQHILSYTRRHGGRFPAPRDVWELAQVPGNSLVCPCAPQQANGYGYNSLLAGKRLADFPRPAAVVLTCDCRPGMNCITQLADISARHRETVAASFLDGHVARVPLVQIHLQ